METELKRGKQKVCSEWGWFKPIIPLFIT